MLIKRPVLSASLWDETCNICLFGIIVSEIVSRFCPPIQVPSFQGHKNKNLPYLLQDMGDFIFFGARDGTFFLQCRPDFQSDTRFRKLLAYNAKSLALYRISASGQSGRLRLQVPSLCIFLSKNIPRFHEGYIFIKLVPEMGLEPTHLSAYAPQAYVSTIPPPGRV